MVPTQVPLQLKIYILWEFWLSVECSMSSIYEYQYLPMLQDYLYIMQYHPN